MFKKIFDFVKSRLFITAFLLCCIFLLSILFWFWGSYKTALQIKVI
ncbi:hypothetical protein H8731_000496 [Campylobacter jejuni]|nr:hypothetical protein [Campylobacter jejuni]